MPAQHVGLAVVVDVDLLALELVGAGEGGFRPARVPVVAVGDEDGAVALARALAVGTLDGDLPSPSAGSTLDDLGAEADLLAQAEVVDEFVEVGGHLEVVGVVRDSGRASAAPCRT